MSHPNGNPVQPIRVILQDSGSQYVNRLMVATPTTGLVRIEWVAARYGQLVPINWSMVAMNQYMSGYIPLRYQVDDAQNLCVRAMLEGEFEWLLLLEHDVILPEDAFMRLDRYMTAAKYPVVSGLYFTRAEPSTPLVFRGRGTGIYTGWEMGELVPVDGVPTGILLVHRALLQAMWDESEEYPLGTLTTRRIFETPRHLFEDPETGQISATSGTSDLAWSNRVIEGEFLKKSGWTAFQDEPYPFIVDTNIFCRHISPDGVQFPLAWHELMKHRKPLKELSMEFIPDGKPEPEHA